MLIPFNREKYTQLLKTDGYPAALSALQQDLLKWEFETFESAKGYQPQIWQELREVRAFSRELWDQASLAVRPLTA